MIAPPARNSMNRQAVSPRVLILACLGVAIAIAAFGAGLTADPGGVLAAQSARSGQIAASQADATPTPAAQPSPTAAPRRGLEAPPLPPTTGAVLVLINLLLALGVVLFAFYLRRRQRR